MQKFEYEWEVIDLPENVKSIFINEIVLSPIYIHISFQKKLTKSAKSKDPFFFMTILNALGLVLTNIDNAPISLNGLRFEEYFDT